MKVNDLYEKHIRHLVLNARDLPRHLAFDLAFEPEVVQATPLQLALLRHSLAFTSIRRAGQRASDLNKINVTARADGLRCAVWIA